MVLIHGNFASSLWWQPLFESGVGRHLLAVDLPGCGRSGALPASNDLEEIAHRVIAAVDPRLDGARFHLVAHSLGAAVAIHLLDLRPERVIDLALFGPAPLDGTAEMAEGDGEMAEVLRRFDPKDPKSRRFLRAGLDGARWIGAHRRQLASSLRRQIPSRAVDGGFFQQLVSVASQQSTDTTLTYFEALAEVAHEDRVAQLRHPVSVVWGEQDTLVPRAAARRMAEVFPNGELSVWPDIGHAPMVEAPERTARHLESFWGQTEAETAETRQFKLVPIPSPAPRGPFGPAKTFLGRMWRAILGWFSRPRPPRAPAP
ncbi:MAG: alpha/beta fold hydrolase [Myxococcota bacterium]